MSKFIDRLNRVTHSAPQPIGFHASQTAPPPVMQLVARLTGDADPSPRRLKGADAALAPVTAITSRAAKLKKLAKERLRDLRLSDPTARLSDTLRAIAQEYGFPSWRALKAEVETLKARNGRGNTEP